MQRHLHISVINVGFLIVLAAGVETRAAAPAQDALVRGIAALHAFEYEDANEAFARARQLDPSLVMAYWGEAMTYHQSLWRNENVQAGRAALARLAPTPEARIAKAHDPKQRSYLTAVEALFGDGDPATRRGRYAKAMEQLAAQYPDDPDVASFYALALLGTMSRSLIGTGGAHEGHSEGLAGSETQTRVATILEKVLQSAPTHIGALHYLLHNDDDPQHARFALAAARTLARLAPDSSHTRHMPAHIFLQLGQWRDAAMADNAAWTASEESIARRHLPEAMRNYHALAWLQYEQLQLGRHREARAAIDRIAPVVNATGDLTLLSDLSSMRARYILETMDWRLMRPDAPFGNANELFALGASAARTGNATVAARAEEALRQRAEDPREGDLRPAIAIMARELTALVALAGGRTDDAVATLRDAASAEARLPPPLGLPAPIKPAPELLGEVLTEAGRPAEAIASFEASLERNANRSLSVLGIARAAAAAGQTDLSHRRYSELLANFDGADSDLPALSEARAALAPALADSARPGAPATVAVMSIAIVAVIAAAVRVRRKTRGPVSRASLKKSSKRLG